MSMPAIACANGPGSPDCSASTAVCCRQVETASADCRSAAGRERREHAVDEARAVLGADGGKLHQTSPQPAMPCVSSARDEHHRAVVHRAERGRDRRLERSAIDARARSDPSQARARCRHGPSGPSRDGCSRRGSDLAEIDDRAVRRGKDAAHLGDRRIHRRSRRPATSRRRPRRCRASAARARCQTPAASSTGITVSRRNRRAPSGTRARRDRSR